MSAWDNPMRQHFHPHIISALRIVYPDKVDAWFKSEFLTSPKGAAKYWAKVLTRRSEMWNAAARRAAAANRKKLALSLKEKIRQKIEQRRKARISSLSTTSSRHSPLEPFKTPSKQVSVALSSDSDDGMQTVIDLSSSPAAAPVSSAGHSPAESQPKLAPHPK